jgi:hypothetical protein
MCLSKNSLAYLIFFFSCNSHLPPGNIGYNAISLEDKKKKERRKGTEIKIGMLHPLQLSFLENGPMAKNRKGSSNK